MKNAQTRIVMISNLVFSSLHIWWFIILAQRINFFTDYLWVPGLLPVIVFVCSLIELSGRITYRLIVLSSYFAMLLITSYVVIVAGTETGGFKFSRVQDVLIYAGILIMMVTLNLRIFHNQRGTSQDTHF